MKILTYLFTFINWIKKSLKWIKDVFDLIKWVLLVVSLITTFGWFKSCSNKNKEISNVTTILTSKIDTFRTQSNLLATQTNTWKIKYKSLENYNNKIQSENSYLNNELFEANKTIKDLNLKAKNVQNYIKNELISKDSMRVNFVIDKDCKNLVIEPIKTKFWSIDFYTRNDSLDVIPEYHSNIYTILNRQARTKKKAIFKKNIGKKHFILPNAGWLWNWDYKTTTVLQDTTANIKNIVSIEFQK